MSRSSSPTVRLIFALALAVTGCEDSPQGSGGTGGGTGGGGGSGGSDGGSGGGGTGGTPVACGNGNVELGEECDGVNLGGASCTSLGNFVGGTLSCDAFCDFNFAACEPPAGCGNGVIDGSEDCDGSALGGASCSTAGDFISGDLTCFFDCSFDTSACVPAPFCGNSRVEAGEDCDGANLGGASCATIPGDYNSGTLACSDCAFDSSGCLFDPCVGVPNGCLVPGSACTGDTLISCAADAFGCLVQEQTDCTSRTNGTCDASGAEPICVSDVGCVDQCVIVGSSCVGDELVSCAPDAFGCLLEELIDCASQPRGFCDDAGAAPTCAIAPDPCAGKPLCDGGAESFTCEMGTDDLVSCTYDLDGCLVRDREDCGAVAGGFCNDDGAVPVCDLDLCFGEPLCAPGTTEGTDCATTTLLQTCALNLNGCMIESLTDCAATPDGYCDADAAPIACTVAVCDNGELEPGEECDPPDGTTCDTDCTLLSGPVCGNEIIESGEQCDPPDGTTCDDSCQTIPVCDNGIIESGEQCDPPDGITCDDACQLITGPVCDNGIIEAGEQCDPPDGITCDAFCQLIAGTTCEAPSPDPGCTTSDPTNCSCFGCNDDATCTLDEDCVCPDCWTDLGCAPIGLCTDNGACEPYGEGCYCADCTDHPECAGIGPFCGNGLVETGEQCDPPDGTSCDASCQWSSAGAPNGAACTLDGDCASGVCLDETSTGWPGGFCGQGCSGAGDCDLGEECTDLGAALVCLPNCTSYTDCRAGYSCFDQMFFNILPVCYPDCASDLECDGGTCNSWSGLCSADFGFGRDGDPCLDGTECESAFCLSEASFGWPGGYCTSLCSSETDLCPGDGVCTDSGFTLTWVCYDGCVDSADCRVADGYSCDVDVCAPGTPGPEDCNNGIDDNANGSYDCEDAACATDPLCAGAPLDLEEGGAACTDGVDNDGDTYTDCNDYSCAFDPSLEVLCGVQENTNAECSNGSDDDLDTWTDCVDASCDNDYNWRVTVCLTTENTDGACNDGVDNDGDTATDCADPGCAAATACGGAGFSEASDGECADGLDNDFDGRFDCADSDCVAATPCNIVLEVMFNELLADPDADNTIGDANCDGTRDGSEDEFVEIYNYGAVDAVLTGLELHDAVSLRHVFPDPTILPPGGVLLVFGGGTPVFDGTSVNPSPWCTNLPATVQIQIASTGFLGLNNGSDTASIQTAGNPIVSQSYTGGGIDESLVMQPELLPGGTLTAHSTVPGSIGVQSPGTLADGSAF